MLGWLQKQQFAGGWMPEVSAFMIALLVSIRALTYNALRTILVGCAKQQPPGMHPIQPLSATMSNTVPEDTHQFPVTCL